MTKKNSDNFNNAEFNGNTNISIGDTYISASRKMIFNESKFKEMLDFLDTEFTEKELYSYDIDNVILKRNQEEKNRRHNIKQESYEGLILEKILPYKEEMDMFFSNPRNKNSIRIYRTLLSSFNIHLTAQWKDFESIFCFFIEISAIMNERFRASIEEYEDDLISLFLCYTYEICDLDKDKGGCKNVSNSK